ncbi:MAG: hypothetical protein A2204_03330 [Elusimicrobia bacterium RIFOXYA1_FULL_47_7]|nr:MAG: hypothetical protein A2278_06510 [Elusimicrobia bacterium RIFOXYA12_FULL_49_49]OGS07025.1 MAG: hypothetical protein A2204_03330 [Elusimicrobia bacterium RIFOXYA1_FULL_47_7]OGS10056.1 MAG: hypothetical protein A2386_07605 [Elusimicrobia bacterium RIFOXYB1_FULL_48_9]OGS16461.1 MAG: hypothetical protein A2251_06515 [Elusimicrobia bacterium RIFOXYA2_FULL_47_53]OGS26034.1 MAG: hypothetical protein A2339_01370 [Elusimicrobia bacterium RIFOXYB12_FULL_50_12]OGS29651.1 MAG: hypothetical protein
MKNEKLPALSFLDVETTGLSAIYNDRICEIGVLRLDPDGTITQWESLINPCRFLSPGAAAVNGITNAMVENAPKFCEVADKLLDMITGSVLVLHNAPFDLSFINMEFENCGIKMPDVKVIDTLIVARQHFNFPSNTLGNIAQHFNIEVSGKHRALADAETTHKIFLRIWEELSKRGIADFDKISTSNCVYPKRTKEKKELPPIMDEALRLKKKVFIKYESSSGAATSRTVMPLEIVSDFDYQYLLAFCHTKKEKRIFRLDRIKEMKILP